MEHPCYQCGAMVEQGILFCPQCNAPQIRVPATENNAASQAEALSATSFNAPPPKSIIDWSQGLPSAFWAAVVSVILMLIPFGGFGLGMLAAGFLSVVLYQRRTVGANLRSGVGAQLGAVSGTFGFGLLLLLLALSTAVMRSGEQIRQKILEAVQEAVSRSADPEARQALEYFKSEHGMVLFMVLGLIFLLIAFIVLSSLGGVLAATVLRGKQLP